MKKQETCRSDVTVIIPTVGRTDALRKAIESVHNQTVPVSKIIIVVDGDDDLRDLVVSQVGKDADVICTGRRTNGNVARNLGVSVVTTRLVAFLDDDDEWKPDRLEKQLQLVPTCGGDWMVTGRVEAVGAAKRRIWPIRMKKANENISEYMFVRRTIRPRQNYIQISSWLGPTELFIQHPFDADLRIHQDFDWILKAIENFGIRLIQSNSTLVTYRINEQESVSADSRWLDSLNWCEERSELFTKRSAGDFLLLVTASFALRQRLPGVALRIYARAVRRYRPSLVAQSVALLKLLVFFLRKAAPTKGISIRQQAVNETCSNGITTVSGIPLCNTNLSDATEKVLQLAKGHSKSGTGTGTSIRLVNAYSIRCASNLPDYKRALTDEGLNFPDGKPVAALMQKKGPGKAYQVRGPSLFRLVLDRGQSRQVRHMLIGGTAATLESLTARLSEDYPRAVIVGQWSPPFGPVDAKFVEDAKERIRDANPQIIWIALGTPKQDVAAARLAQEVPGVYIAVGAAFDFVAGTKKECPEFLRALYLEWLYRLSQEPRRLSQRYLIGNAVFLSIALREILNGKPAVGASGDERDRERREIEQAG